ncbi:EthD domain-containing protein [Camillea tinctor]|nr:EthD domain-containing protein [Camillea tinctor]
MTHSIIIFAYRKPGAHVPLLHELASEHFPLSHTRRYIDRSQGAVAPGAGVVDGIERNPTTPATVIIGSQADFDYDAVAELTFENSAAFQAFFGIMQQPDNAAKMAAGEKKFLDRSRMPVVVLGDTKTTTK